MWDWLHHLRGKAASPRTQIPDALWQQTLSGFPFLRQCTSAELSRLRELSGRFLEQKEFHGAQELVVTDAMAVAIAAQACLPVLHMGPGAQPRVAAGLFDQATG